MTMKVALVTGGARGIGFGISKCLAKDGFTVAVCGTKDESDVAGPMSELKALSPDSAYFKCDISNSTSRAAMIEGIKARFGKLNFLVNNAGIAPTERKDILDAGEESFEKLIRTNLQGPYFLTQLAARWMVEQKTASSEENFGIVNVSSISAAVASVNRGDYCISKAGVSMASKLWAVRLGEFNIPVYEVRPGIIKTDMTAGVTEKYDKLLAEGVALQRRWGMPEDIGRAVAMLLRGDMLYSTGSVIMVDGGLTIPRL